MTKRSGGEDKKNSGVLGEAYVSNFLNLIGWKIHQSGNSINCTNEEKHNKSTTQGTHGIDKFYSYESSLDSSTLIHAVISSKHTKNIYKNTDFKNHFIDLADTVECYECSTLIEKNREDVNVSKEQIIGILFWLSSQSDRNYSIIPSLSQYRLPNSLHYDRIQIIDNNRIEFLTQSIETVKKRFNDYQFEFYYIDTPNNIASDRRYSGKQLPVEMLNSDIQVFRLQKNQNIMLAIVNKDEFCSDSLKRVLGLAHKVSNNLTNNVQIFFPNFEHEVQDNKNEIERIKNLFKDKDFISTTNIYGYNIGFKDTKTNIELSNEVSNENITEPKIDNGKILPYGEPLRTLVNHSDISESELNLFLKQKGIYVCNHIKKEFTVPIVSSLLLSPKEFELLKNYHEITENKDKRRSSTLETTSNITGKELSKVLNQIDLNQIAKSKFPKYRFEIPEVSFKLDEEKKQLFLEYEIESYNRNKSWDEQIRPFKGQVIFDYSRKSLEITSKNIYTSSETLEINRKIINYAKSELKKANIIKNMKEDKILMDELDNSQILKFLLSFTDNSSFSDIEFNNITSIDIELENKNDIPEDSDVKWMESNIKKLKLDGARIEELKILRENENHQYLKCWGIIAEYKIDSYKIKGSATVRLEFHKTATGKNCEFMIVFDKYKYDKKLYSQKTIDELILKELDSIKHEKYKEIKKEVK